MEHLGWVKDVISSRKYVILITRSFYIHLLGALIGMRMRPVTAGKNKVIP